MLLDFLGGVGGDSYRSEQGGEIDVVPSETHALVGYRWLAQERFVWDVLVGWNFINYDLSRPDPTNPIRGSENGFKISSSFETAWEKKYYFLISGEYSTALDTYFSNVRLGYRLRGDVVIGPEGSFLGDQSFNRQRPGAFVQSLKIATNFEPQLQSLPVFPGWIVGMGIQDSRPGQDKEMAPTPFSRSD